MTRKDKVRIDKLVVETGLAATREKARRLVLAGEVLVDDVPVEKPGMLVDRGAGLRLRNPPSPWVGRGGDKLAGALDALDLDVTASDVLDIGASTGGFTDCLLQQGAASVTALDVGRGQLDWKLRSDPRVRVVEGFNARYLERKDFPEGFDLVTVDVSFISLSMILPAAVLLVRKKGRLLVLVKPQFELAREDVASGGVVRDPKKHLEALRRVAAAAETCELVVEALTPSPITGMEGNREFFLLMTFETNNALDRESFDERAKKVCGLE
jgi:23S rRNA (cytidine1920-2'-O)/16S rRNA (cytidine1409-2'-O)-methyltransferase